MSGTIKLLLAEDSEDDAKLLIRALRDGGFDVRHECVVSAAAMAAALERQSWDAIISDYNMPGFSGLDALTIARATGRDIPFILISGTVGEEIAVDAMKAGANDYVLKTNISRLASVLKRELQEAANRTRRRRAEFEVRKLSVAIRQSGAGIVITDPAGIIEFVNPKFEAMTGYAASEIEGKNPRFLKSGLTPAQTYRELWATIKAGKEWHGELQNRKKDGELYWENQRITPVLDDKGAILNFISVKNDVTEEKRVAQALRESEAGLRRAQAMARQAHVITRQDGSFERWSETLPGIAGLAPERMPRTTREWLELVHAEDRELFRRTSLDAGAGGARKDLEYRLRRADGGVANIRQVMEPIAGSADAQSRTRWFNTLQDVTEQRRAQEDLRESELRFRQLAENIHEVFFLIDPANTQMLYISPAYEQIWQRGVASLYANPQSWSDSIYPEDRERVFASFPDQQRTGRFDYEYRVVRPDGTLRWVHARGFPIRDAAGALYRIAGIAEDTTERKAAEDKVRRLNRVYAVLSGINTLIVRVRDRDELFQEACQIARQAGQFIMAWIGIVEHGTGRIIPVASAGADAEYMSFIRENFTLTEDAPLGDTLVARAVREKKNQFSNDAQNDPRVRFQKEHARRGSRSLAVLPLLVAGEAAGVLVLYTTETGFFDEEELKLLSELAGDIAFAMEHLEVLGKVEYLAFHDPLTDLPNRAVLVDHLDLMIRTARREQRLAGVVFFDIERLRHVNETLGRQAGDQVLKQVAERMRHAARAGDTPARVSGDAFAMAVSGFSRIEEATHMLTNRMTRAFLPPMVIDGQELRVVLKAGAAVYPSDGDSAEALCANAEAALKKAKETGERYVFYTPEINARVAESLAMENRLRGALEAGQFVLHYQPKVDTRTRAILGMEALIRWNDPELGLVPPGKFIPLMEETGLILEAGRWALGRAVADIQAWRAKGYAVPRVAVNVSPIQLRQPDFVKSVLDALEGFGDGEPVLDLEITESMVMQNFEPTIRALQTLRGVGVETSLDDFGTGYSSLAYVARLPVAALKIDRSFIIEMTTSNYARTIVQTVISLAHSLGLKVIAEGVDHEDQVAILAALGCDQMQGYLISKPLPFDEITALIASGQPAHE